MAHPTPVQVQRTYLTLTLFQTLATSFIWGVNTLFLLDGGLNPTEAFAANAFFTVGQVIFEVPTGVVADTAGRRVSYALGAATLAISTFLYLLAWRLHAGFWAWAVTSILLGLGFTFFSGATEAWLVDALAFTGYKGKVETVFARAQVVGGAAMLVGSVAGGFVAQASSLGVPYLLRSGALLVTLAIALLFMKDLGFKPVKGGGVVSRMTQILRSSIDGGLRKPAVRWVMLAGPFGAGVGIYAFYAMQPYLLELYGNRGAYGVAGLAAAIVAGAQIVGGLVVPLLGKMFRTRSAILLAGVCVGCAALALIGLVHSFWAAIGLLIVWGLVFAAVSPVRQAYLNGLIPSSERATILSFDNLVGSSGGAVFQPVLGRVADIWSYGASYVVSAVVGVMALPFLFLARREKPSSDPIPAG